MFDTSHTSMEELLLRAMDTMEMVTKALSEVFYERCKDSVVIKLLQT